MKIFENLIADDKAINIVKQIEMGKSNDEIIGVLLEERGDDSFD